MPLSFYPTRQQPHTLAMVVDGTRIPPPSPSRSRLARPTQPSRIPPPRSATTTPRRTPRQPSSIPTPRSASREPRTPRDKNDFASPKDRPSHARASPRDPRTPLRRTPVKPTDRTDPPSVRTPRRAATTRPDRSAIPSPRRASKESLPRVGVPRYCSRLSASSQEPPKTRPRIQEPSPRAHVTAIPGSQRRLSNTSRPGLSPSPYPRRTSNGGNIRAMAGVTPRRLNMGTEDESRRLSNTAATRRLSAAKDRLADRIEQRRESLTGARRDSLTGARRESLTSSRRESLTGGRRESLGSRRGMSALESFRASRRASLEAEKKKLENQENQDVVMTDEPATNPMELPVFSASTPAAPVPAVAPMLALPEQTLPDRQDPLGLGNTPLTPSGKPRRKSTRFSEADICLDGVEALRKSLGRRRSVGYGEPIPEDMETPTLRRSSIGERLKLQQEMEKREEAERQAALERERQRLPLCSLESNKENMQSVEEKTEKRRSIIPTLEGDEFDWNNEEVEDLGP